MVDKKRITSLLNIFQVKETLPLSWVDVNPLQHLEPPPTSVTNFDLASILDKNLDNNLDNNLEDNLDNNTVEAAAVKESDSYSLQVYMSDGQVCFPFLSEI